MQPPNLFDTFLREKGLASADEPVRWQPLTGGVSSDVWLACLPGRDLVIKQALQQLKVAADWQAPLERNGYEWAWMVEMRGHLPEAVPAPIARDAEHDLFAMGYLPPADYPIWKDELIAGRIDVGAAAEVGRRLAILHAATAGVERIRKKFETTDLFFSLRLDPYLFATAARHPALADHIHRIATITAAERRCLVHGDVSPKNILLGPNGPIFLDAECAWYGDPAFDLAFCLNHLLLGTLRSSQTAAKRLEIFAAMSSAYLAGVRWEDRAQLERRTATLLPALMLARVDGKSPLDYLAEPDRQAIVRDVASTFLQRPPERLAAIGDHWREAIGAAAH